MSHTSPATFLVWAIMSSLLGAFLLFHLWKFDRFQCLKWNSGPNSGAFKRVMTYSYFLSIPLIMAYAIGNSIIKYHEGFVALPGFGVIPKPYQLWEPARQHSIFPLMLCFSIAWSFEMVTHLEELCFWLYLVNSTSSHQDWFKSLYFKTWVFGSAAAIIYMPLVTIFTRNDPLKSEAYTFLAGSLGSLSLTLWFTPILWTFPTFLKNLRSEGIDRNTIVRLTKFEELNRIRVTFRLFFTVPLLILGCDGVRPHHHINESMASTDVLGFISAFGCAVSSGITMVIFFPRSIEGEIAARDERKRTRTGRSMGRPTSILDSRVPSRMNTDISDAYSYAAHSKSNHAYLLTASPVKASLQFNTFDGPASDTTSHPGHSRTPQSVDKLWQEEERDHLPPLRPNRRYGQEVELGTLDTLTETNLSIHNMGMSNINPMVHGFTSPINFAYGSAPVVNTVPRYTFARK